MLFDCDGVLADTEPLNYLCWNLALVELCGVSLPDQVSVILGLDLEQIVDIAFAHSNQSKPLITQSLKQALLEKKYHLFCKHAPGYLRVAPGVQSLLRLAKKENIPCAVVSRARRQRLMKTLEWLSLIDNWQAIFAGEDLLPQGNGVYKKNWQSAALRCGTQTRQCVVFEDSKQGLISAKEQGVGYRVAVASGYDKQAFLGLGVNQIISSLKQLDTRFFSMLPRE